MRRAPPLPPGFGGVRFPGDVVGIELPKGTPAANARKRGKRDKTSLFEDLPEQKKPGEPEAPEDAPDG